MARRRYARLAASKSDFIRLLAALSSLEVWMPGRWGRLAGWWRTTVLLGLVTGLGAAACPKNDATGPKITRIVIAPKSVSLHPGQQATFFAYGRTAAGDSMAASVSYGASGGSISIGGGVYTAGAVVGTYHAYATQTGGTLSDTANITIDSLPPAPVATVTVTPPHPTITAGTTVSLTATTRDSNGAVLTGRVVTWTSGTTAAGTVDANGIVTGVAAGTTIITATSEGKQGKDTVTVTAPTATLVRITMTPDSTAVDTGHTVQFTVTGKFSDSSTASVPATYAATGGSITTGGLYKAGATAGSFRVIATATGFSFADTSKVTVFLPSLVRVILTPDSASVDTGHTAQFSVQGKFSDSSVAAVTVNYSATGGTISAGGLYTAATTAGTFHVIAVKTGGTLADTSKVVVVALTPTPAECANPQPGWIWCDDFEQDRLSSYFETDGVGTVFNRVAGVGKDSSYGMKGHFTAGANSAGDLHLAFGHTPQSYMAPVDAGTANYREIYWRMYVRAQAGWVGGAHDKLSRALIFGSSTSFAEAIAAHVWGGDVPSDSNNLIIDPASGVDSAGNLITTTYNDPKLVYLGKVETTTPIFNSASVGQWYCVEAHVKLNDSGSSNGLFELWINGNLEAQKTSMNWVSSYSAYGINAIYFENYWNNGATVAEDRFFDNIVVSTQRIGC